MALTREQILTANDLPKKRVDVPEWAPEGTDPKESYVFIRKFNGEDREWYDSWFMRHADASGKLPSHTVLNIAAMLCSLAVCDEQGNRLFTESDIEALGKKNGEALERCYVEARSWNGLGKKAVEDAEKNS